MRTIDCDTLEDLTAAIAALGPDALFRGQSREYVSASGEPDLRTSFTRKGCIPPTMLKWQHHASQILRAFVRDRGEAFDLATDQAVLQHYGWRSFFLDATRDPSVAAWFAGHEVVVQNRNELIEDAYETPLIVQRQCASSTPATGHAVLYALSRRALRRHGLQAVDLEEIVTATGRPRYQAQAAFMIGPLQEPLPVDCIAARVRAPAELFRAYADTQRSLTLQTLFPDERDDPVLAALLGIPWVRTGAMGDMGVFRRGLALPEYGASSIRRTGTDVAYYTPFWIADAAAGSSFRDTTFYLAHETFFHGGPPADTPLPRLTNLLKETPFIALEMNGLMSHPATAGSRQYRKGILIERQNDGLILVCEIVVEHRGCQPETFGLVRGVYYRPDEAGSWTLVDHPEQCDCGDVRHHRRHRIVVARFEHALADAEFTEVRPAVWAMAGVPLLSDPEALARLRSF